jgi:hypothetical protein
VKRTLKRELKKGLKLLKEKQSNGRYFSEVEIFNDKNGRKYE